MWDGRVCVYLLPCQLRDGWALQGDLTQQVSGDREAGPEPADCPPRPSAAAGVKKRLLSCWGRGMRPLRPAGHSPLCPVRWDRGSGQGGSAGRGRTAQECGEWVKALSREADGPVTCPLANGDLLAASSPASQAAPESGLRNGLVSEVGPVWGCCGGSAGPMLLPPGAPWGSLERVRRFSVTEM